MSYHAADPSYAAQNATHVTLARRFWTPTEDFYGTRDPLPTSQSASGGHPGDAAVPDAPSPLADLRDARKRLRGHGVALAGSAAVTPQPSRETPPPIPAVIPTFVSFAAERVSDGPWGPCCWVVSNVVTGMEIARYSTVGLDGPGAILRALQEELCWQEREGEAG